MALLNSSNKVKAMSSGYTEKLGFKIWKTNIEAKKIDGHTLEIFGIIIPDF